MRICFVALVAVLVSLSAPARAAVLESTNIDNWSIRAFSYDRTGQFSHCATAVPYRSGISLLFSVNGALAWSMGLANSQWNLKPGAEFSFSYFIDRGPMLHARGRAINHELVQVPLENSSALFQTFRQGHVLTVQSGRATFRFSLRNSSTALAMTLDCARRYVARNQTPPSPSYGAQQSQSSGQPSGSGPPRANEQLQAEATIVLANILSMTGVQNFRVLPREEIPLAYQGWAAVWSAPGLIGGMGLVGQHDATEAAQVATILAEREAKVCKGVFVSERIPALIGANVARLRTGCSEGDNFVETSYSIAPRGKGGFYVFGVAGKTADAKSARSAGEKLYQAVLKLPSR
jgi:hypothetical protein